MIRGLLFGVCETGAGDSPVRRLRGRRAGGMIAGVHELAAGSLLAFTRDELLHQVQAAAASVRLASPFLSKPVSKEITRCSPRRASTHRLLTAGLLGRSRAVSSPLAGCACSRTPATRPHPESAREAQSRRRQLGHVGSGNLTAEIARAMRVVERMDNGSLLAFADRVDLDTKQRSQRAPRGELGLSRRSTRKRRRPSPRAARTRSATSSPQAARSGQTRSPSPS